MKDSETFTKFGKFTVAPGREVYGELRVAGKESSLYTYSISSNDSASVLSYQ
jgi:hypothetical protein